MTLLIKMQRTVVTYSLNFIYLDKDMKRSKRSNMFVFKNSVIVYIHNRILLVASITCVLKGSINFQKYSSMWTPLKFIFLDNLTEVFLLLFLFLKIFFSLPFMNSRYSTCWYEQNVLLFCFLYLLTLYRSKKKRTCK